MQDSQTLTPEQQQHRLTSALSRKLYQVEERLETLQGSLSQPHDASVMMQAGIQLNSAVNEIRQVASSLYQTKKTLETNHPELAAEAKAYGEKMKEKRQDMVHQSTQSF
ncbi:hypothetical protein EYS14_00080 [Alteromonadaceae bacterium M269]|nr:hypothetical protein EYS14_00080 [Alteromonadaceae bacterium M269]